MRPKKLDETALATELDTLPEWTQEPGADQPIVREFKFRDFAGAMCFVNHVAEAAESANHHPDIDIRYNRVRIALVTHDAGGITLNDIQMARQIDSKIASDPEVEG